MADQDVDCAEWDDSDWEHASVLHFDPECHVVSDEGYDTESSTWLLLDEHSERQECLTLSVGIYEPPELVNKQQRKAHASPTESLDLTRSQHAETKKTSICPHWLESGCQLTGTPNRRWCCACSNRRPRTASGLYEAYVDGTGWVKSAERWEHYCPGCKAAGHSSRDLLSGERAVDGHDGEVDDKPQSAEAMPATSSTNSGPLVIDVVVGTAPAAASMTTRPATPVDPSLAVPKICERQSHSHKSFITAHRHHTFAITPTQRTLLHQSTRCKHWVDRACQLTATRGRCCQCADARAQSVVTSAGGYSSNSNGSITKACVYYCPACKDRLLPSHSSKSSASIPAAAALLRQRAEAEQTYCEIQLARTRQEQERDLERRRQQRDQHGMMPAHKRQRQRQQAQPERGCFHWRANACSLSSKVQCCCACSDMRDLARAYVKYVDGQGDVLAAARWEYYCPGCRGASKDGHVGRAA